MYNVFDLVRLLINKLIDEEVEYNITKIHKLLYIVYGVFLAKIDLPISSESPVCYEYGPIFKSIQRDYKKGVLHLDRYEIIIDDLFLDPFVNLIMDSVIDKFGCYETIPLVNWIQREESAWFSLAKDVKWGAVIPDKLIKKEFRRVVK